MIGEKERKVTRGFLRLSPNSDPNHSIKHDHLSYKQCFFCSTFFLSLHLLENKCENCQQYLLNKAAHDDSQLLSMNYLLTLTAISTVNVLNTT